MGLKPRSFSWKDRSTVNIQHSSRSDSWGTPQHIIDKVKPVLGGTIDLDPASNEKANQKIQATSYFTKEDDALNKSWIVDSSGFSVYCNPPGGKKGNRSMASLFWDELMSYHEQGFITQAIFMCFLVEALQHSQLYPRRPMSDFIVCIPKRRIAFVGEDESKQSPSHSNAIIYVPGLVDNSQGFASEFISIGSLMRPF